MVPSVTKALFVKKNGPCSFGTLSIYSYYKSYQIIGSSIKEERSVIIKDELV